MEHILAMLLFRKAKPTGTGPTLRLGTSKEKQTNLYRKEATTNPLNIWS